MSPTARPGGPPTPAPDGAFLYAPRNNYTGTDSFRYRVYDGRLESARIGTVTITVCR